MCGKRSQLCVLLAAAQSEGPPLELACAARGQKRQITVQAAGMRPVEPAMHDPVPDPVRLPALFHESGDQLTGSTMIRMRIERTCGKDVRRLLLINDGAQILDESPPLVGRIGPQSAMQKNAGRPGVRRAVRDLEIGGEQMAQPAVRVAQEETTGFRHAKHRCRLGRLTGASHAKLE